jgi:hypothetical protein
MTGPGIGQLRPAVYDCCVGTYDAPPPPCPTLPRFAGARAAEPGPRERSCYDLGPMTPRDAQSVQTWALLRALAESAVSEQTLGRAARELVSALGSGSGGAAAPAAGATSEQPPGGGLRDFSAGEGVPGAGLAAEAGDKPLRAPAPARGLSSAVPGEAGGGAPPGAAAWPAGPETPARGTAASSRSPSPRSAGALRAAAPPAPAPAAAGGTEGVYLVVRLPQGRTSVYLPSATMHALCSRLGGEQAARQRVRSLAQQAPAGASRSAWVRAQVEQELRGPPGSRPDGTPGHG